MCGGQLRGIQAVEGLRPIKGINSVGGPAAKLGKRELESLHRQLKKRMRVSDPFGCDTDRNNMLSFTEFCDGVALMGIRPVPSEEALAAIFNMYDLSRDGYIQWEELCKDNLDTPQGASRLLCSLCDCRTMQ